LRRERVVTWLVDLREATEIEIAGSIVFKRREGGMFAKDRGRARIIEGLANQLAAHMGFSAEEIDRVGRFWSAPLMARREGLKAVAMMEAVARGRLIVPSHLVRRRADEYLRSNKALR
jgi:hypothetical protein